MQLFSSCSLAFTHTVINTERKDREDRVERMRRGIDEARCWDRERRRKGGQREREREVCRLLYQADLDRRRGLDTLHLWRDSVTAAVDMHVCVCAYVLTCMFIHVYCTIYDVQIFSLESIKVSLNHLK